MNAIDRAAMQSALHQALRQDFRSFARKAFAVVSPDLPFKPNWHVDAIAHALERCVSGEVKRLLITLPPRHGKSILCSVALPAFILGRDPTQRIICASYAQDLSAKFGRDTRAVMQQPWYAQAFPNTVLSGEKQNETELMTTARGGRLSTSVGGTLLGRGGKFIVIDEAMKAEEALSDAKRAAVTSWFDATVTSRLDPKEDGVIIVVMQRLQVDDLAGHLLAKGNYQHLNLPAIAPSEAEIATGWGRSYRRKAGEVLHPGLASAAALKAIEAEIGSFMFSALYQQEPVPLDGALIKWSWFQTYDEEPTRQERDRIIQSWDTAMTPGDSADYSACTTWLQRGNHYYLLDVLRDRLDYPSLKSRIVSHRERWSAKTLLIEDTASGKSLIQDLRRAPNMPQPIAIKVKGDKVTRLVAVSAMIEAKQVFLPKQAPWLADFRSEMLQFPKGRYDDQVDSLSQFLNWQRGRANHDDRHTAAVGSKLIDLDPMSEPDNRDDPDIVDISGEDDYY